MWKSAGSWAIAIRGALGGKAPTLIAVTGYAGIAKLGGVRSVFDDVMTKPANG
jgi:hypothetical protein